MAGVWWHGGIVSKCVRFVVAGGEVLWLQYVAYKSRHVGMVQDVAGVWWRRDMVTWCARCMGAR